MDETSKIFVGPIHSNVAGRTDHLPVNLSSGSYVLPADIVSAAGEGNTSAGFRIFNNVFGKQETSPDTEPVEVIVAGGEYVIGPETVIRIGGGDMDNGHKILDDFVKEFRAKTIKTLKGLPGPRND